jgi:threonine synthase
MAPQVDFEGALFSGYAPDGGLYMPEELPQLDRETLRHWSMLSYPGLVKELCALFIGSELIPRNDLNGECPQPLPVQQTPPPLTHTEL